MQNANTIIIIESPNKEEKISKITGAKVYATKGHFKVLTNEIVKDYENYEPIFEFKNGANFAINKILNECRGKEVIIATDPDREGYGIAYMFYDMVKGIANSVKRAEFHEITESGIKKGLAAVVNFANSNLNEWQSFKARVVGDKLAGFILSPKYINLLNDKNISVGRVQTPALNLIVQRENEINAFNSSAASKQIDYKIKAKLAHNGLEFDAVNDNLYGKIEEAEARISELNNIKTANVFNIETKQTEIKPHEPFRTSQYQEAANKKFGFNSEVAMSLAQKLFEKGLITYHRTDSNNLSEEFINELEAKFQNEPWYQKRFYKAGNQSQAEAHEAIRISHVHDYSDIKQIAKDEKLSDDEIKIYTMIYENSILSQAKNAINENKIYDFNVGTLSFKTKTIKCIYMGFKGVFSERNEDENEQDDVQEINLKLNQGDKVQILSYELVKVKKQAPKRYKESNFISLLERQGIGRPSTYATFLPTLLKREYIEIRQKGKNSEIIPTSKGMNFMQNVLQGDEWITKSEFTKQMENVLDLISENKASYLEFIKPLHEKMGFERINSNKTTPPTQKQLDYAKKLAEQQNIALPQGIETDYKICSAFIDKAKKQMPPSPKQIKLAKDLARDKNLELPKGYDNDVEICKTFIDRALKKKS